MNLYLITTDEGPRCPLSGRRQHYECYDEAVVCAGSDEEAASIHPSGKGADKWGSWASGWCERPDQVKVELIGTAASHVKRGVVLASFCAG